jgi:hypothetical protein
MAPITRKYRPVKDSAGRLTGKTRVVRKAKRTAVDVYVAVVWTGQGPHRDDGSMSCWVGPKDEVTQTAVRYAERWNGQQQFSPVRKKYIVLVGKLGEQVEEIVIPPKLKVTKITSLKKFFASTIPVDAVASRLWIATPSRPMDPDEVYSPRHGDRSNRKALGS